MKKLRKVKKLTNSDLIDFFHKEVRHIQPTVFIEVGCREGEASIITKNCIPSCKVFAYEAGKETYDLFHEQIAEADVIHKNLAISNEKGSGSFYKNKDRPTIGSNSLMTRINRGAWTDEQKVSKNTLDNLHNTNSESFCLWIDAEGHGYEVLQGAKEVLKKTQLVFIEVEETEHWINQKLDRDILEFLANDFDAVARDQEYPKQYNLVFKRKSK